MNRVLDCIMLFIVGPFAAVSIFKFIETFSIESLQKFVSDLTTF